MVDSTLAFDILARDRASSAFNKVERAADKTAAALKRSIKISDDVAKAEQRLSKARDGEADAMGRVKVAEQRLQEFRDKGLEGTSRFTAAEEQLSAARRKAAQASNTAKLAEDSLGKARAKLTSSSETAGRDAGTAFGKSFGAAADKEGAKSGKRFGSSLKRWLTGSGGLGDAGKAGGTVFGSGFLGVLKTPILGPAVVGAITAGIVTAMPAVGAVAAAGLVAGFGAGLGALGMVFAAKSVAVKNAWNRTLWAMAADMRVISAPFEKTLLNMATFARRTFTNLTPSLLTAFKSLGPSMSQFGDDLGRAFEKLGPAIQPVNMAFQAVLKSLGPAMQAAMASFSKGLQIIAASVQKSPDALSDLATGVGNLFVTLSSGLAILNNLNDAFKILPGGASLVTRTMNTLNATVAAAFGPFLLLQKGMEAVGLKSKQASQDLKGMQNSVVDTAATMKLWTQGLDANKVAAINNTNALQGNKTGLFLVGEATVGVAAKQAAAAAAANSLAAKFDRQWAATQKANDALTRMSGLLLTLSGSEIAFQQAIDDATQSIKDNGKTHDINTAKGRANKTALDQVAASANAQTIAMRNAGDGNVSAARHAEGARANFVKLATQMGYTVPQAKAMAANLIAIPNVTRTAKLQANKKDLEAKLAAAQKELDNPKGVTKARKTELRAEIAKLQAGIATAKGLLATVPPSKTVTITTRLVTERIARTVSGASGGHVPTEARAAGGPVNAGQPYLVGEKGPEIVVPKTSGVVIPNDAIKTGSNVVAGLAQGAAGSATSAYSAVAQIAAGMISKAREVLQISSPSKAFAKLGLYVTQGFSIGLRGSAKQVQSVMASLMSKVLDIAFNAADTKKAIQKQITAYNAAIAAARKRIRPITSDMTKAEADKVRRNNAAATASIKSLQQKLASAKVDLANVNAIASRLGTTKKRNAVIGMIQRENAAMQKLANARAAVAVQLKAAQDKLAAAIQVRDEFKKAITDSAIAFNAITNIQAPEGEKLTAAGIIAQMTETLRRTQTFAANLAKLKAKGLNATVYKQIAEAGVDQGGAIAEALLGGNANTFNTINKVQANINSAAAGLGSTAAKNLYQAGVDAAQGLVNGLLAKTKALDAASKKLADAIVAQIKKTLGIRSPSKVLEWHGSMAGRGFALGIEGEYGRVRRAGVGLGSAAAPGAQRTPVAQRSAGGAAMNVYITVQGAVDPIATAKQIQQLLLNLKQKNGRVELGIA